MPYQKLKALYSEPHRRYHNLDHIYFMLKNLDDYLNTSPYFKNKIDLASLRAAIWFHDAIYDPTQQDNEEKSAALAASELKNLPEFQNRIKRIEELILSTKTHRPDNNDIEANILTDLDLSILGTDPKTFSTYDQNIRKEYAWVPREEYCRKRKEILESFFKKRNIYQLKYFQDKFESQAKANLNIAIKQLKKCAL